jgi:hypothetical protein
MGPRRGWGEEDDANDEDSRTNYKHIRVKYNEFEVEVEVSPSIVQSTSKSKSHLP